MSNAMSEVLQSVHSAMAKIDDLTREGRADELRAVYQIMKLENDRVVEQGKQDRQKMNRVKTQHAKLLRRLINVLEEADLLVEERIFTREQVLGAHQEGHRLENKPTLQHLRVAVLECESEYRELVERLQTNSNLGAAAIEGIEEELRQWEAHTKALEKAAGVTEAAADAVQTLFDQLLEALTALGLSLNALLVDHDDRVLYNCMLYRRREGSDSKITSRVGGPL
ncbi:hypothetical protein PENSPDRAFT_751359 [Peniophora sp. CONT]|nr:hypothetical protein PENSPDRAFT_751359 [Peniophora sp. CONT]